MGLDRIAVIAALNLANDMLKLRATGQSVDEHVLPRVRNLRGKVENALKTEPLEL